MTKIKWKCTNNKISDSRHWDSSLICLKHTSDGKWLIIDDRIVQWTLSGSFLKNLKNEKNEKYYFKICKEIYQMKFIWRTDLQSWFIIKFLTRLIRTRYNRLYCVVEKSLSNNLKFQILLKKIIYSDFHSTV